jgi:hypothetical protein
MEPLGSLILRPARAVLHQTPTPYTRRISARPRPQACRISVSLGHAGLHRPAQYPLCKPVPLRPAKPGTHTLTISIPLSCATEGCQAWDPQTHRISTLPACALQACRYTLQRPATSPQLKASTTRPMRPHPPATPHRKAPNLPKRHTQTGLDAKELTSEQLRLQFCCSTTGDFFFSFFFPSLRDLLPCLLCDHPPSLPIFFVSFSVFFLFFSFSSLLYSFYLSISLSFLFFCLGFVSINIVTQLILTYTESRDRNGT